MILLSMISLIGFVISLLLYTIYLYVQSRKNNFEKELIEAMRIISETMKNGAGLETAVTKISQQPGQVSSMFKLILIDVNNGLSFVDALHKRGKHSSRIFTYFGNVMKLGAETGEDISSMLDALSEKVWSIKHLEEEIRTKTTVPLLMLQFIAIFLIPVLFVYASGAIGYSVDVASYAFLSYIAFIFSIIDFIIFKDGMKALLSIPLFASIFGIGLTLIAPLFENFFRL